MSKILSGVRLAKRDIQDMRAPVGLIGHLAYWHAVYSLAYKKYLESVEEADAELVCNVKDETHKAMEEE